MVNVHRQVDRPGQAPRALSERGKRRLQLAAALLRSAGLRFEQPRAGFYDAIVQAIDAMRPEHRQRLRADVDWVEAYDCEEQRRSELPRHARPVDASLRR